MSAIKGKTLFFTTSPRTPLKMVPEIKLLSDKFEGRSWDAHSQAEFMYELITMDFYEGSQQLRDPAFSARDRMNRAPKAYGFVDLKPTISLTDAGKAFVEARHKGEILLRQLIKFQLPSPFHTVPSNGTVDYCVKPYLEIIRLIRYFGSISFDEIMLFGMQLVDYHIFDEIISKIEKFRIAKANNKGKYRNLLNQYFNSEIRRIYSEEFESGNFHTRESSTKTAEKFVKTKRGNLRDYTDACFRYLRATGIVTISQSGHSLSIAPEKIEEVDYLLSEVSRDPVFAGDEKSYKKYLFNPELPKLYSDNLGNLVAMIHKIDPSIDCSEYSIVKLKDLLYDLLEQEKQRVLDEKANRIKNYEEYDEIVDIYKTVVKSRDSFFDRPLMFEWNTWRAMTMIDGGKISANLKFDDAGRPLSTAPGNTADVVCDYGDFILNVEVTLQSGQKQYDNEGEPVARHVGKTKEATGKPTYCFFIAPTINDASIAHFFMLSRTPVRHYGGKAMVIPLELATFEKMLADSKKASYVPNPQHILRLIEYSRSLSSEAADEVDWFNRTKTAALDWLSLSQDKSLSSV